MLQEVEPDDYGIATGEQHSVKEFVEAAAPYFGMRITWEGEGLNEVGVDSDGIVRVRVNERYFRPAEVETLLGDSSKANPTAQVSSSKASIALLIALGASNTSESRDRNRSG